MAVNGLTRPVRLSSKDGSTNGENDHLLPKLTTQFSGGPIVGGPGTPSVRQRQFTVGELQALQPGSPSTEARAAKPRYESLDYEEVENIVYRSDKAAGGALDGVMLGLSKWTVCFLIGFLTAVAAFFVNFSVENIAGFKFWATLTILGKGYKFGSFLAYASMNMVLVLMAVGMTLFVGPAAAGSGIPDVKAYLNGIDVPGIFYFSTLVAKLLGSITAVAGGLAIGKEGPFVHAGACIAALISQGGTQSCHTRITHHLWNDRDRADMVTAGAAAGVAAAFRSPVGGVLFALEEMSSWWRNQLMWLIFFTTAVVSVTVRFLMKACSASHCGFFGSGGFIYFEIEDAQDRFEIYELLPMLLLGVVGGLLGSSFIVLNGHLAHLRKKHLAKYGVRGRLAEGAAISALTSMVSFLLPLFFICQRCPKSAGDMCPRKDDSHSGNFVAFGCTHPNQYSDLATLFFNTQDDAIRALFSSSTKREYSVPTLLLFVTSFYFLAVITYGMSCPTGLFVPSILCGAAYGRLVGIFVADMYPHMHVDEGTYALLGAASFLGGSMRMAVCTCVMLLELTNNLALLPLVMLVLLVAKAVGDGTGIKPIYEMQMQYKGLPFLEPSPDPIMRHLTAKECCGRPPVSLNRVERVSRIVDILRSCSHNGFPVLHTTNADGDKALAGVVLRQHLLLLLTSRNAFQTAPYVTEAASRVATTFSVSDFQKPISAPGLSIHDVQLSTEELCQYLDLGPYLNPSYYVVQDDASLSKVYTLFRTLGVRHLCVIPKAHEVVGIITREDLQSEIINERLEAGGGQFGTDGTLAGSSRGRRGFGADNTPSSSGRRSLGTSPYNTPDTSVRDGAMSGRAMQSRMQQGGAGAAAAVAAAAALGDGGVLGLGNRTRTSYTGEQKNRTSYTGEPKGRTRTSHTGATGGVGGNGGAGAGFGHLNFGGGWFTEQQGIDLLPNLPSNEVPMGPGPSGLHRAASMRKTVEQGAGSPSAGFGGRSAMSVLGPVGERAPLLGLPPRAGGRATTTELASIPDESVALRGDLLDIESGKGFKSRRTGSSRPGAQVGHKD